MILLLERPLLKSTLIYYFNEFVHYLIISLRNKKYTSISE